MSDAATNEEGRMNCGECWPNIETSGDPEMLALIRDVAPKVSEGTPEYERPERALSVASVGLFGVPVPAEVFGPHVTRVPIFEKWVLPDGRVVGRKHYHERRHPAEVVLLSA